MKKYFQGLFRKKAKAAKTKISDLDLGLGFEIGDTIWIFKRHSSTICWKSDIDDYIKPISHKIETLNFFYDVKDGVYKISTRINNSWYNLGENNVDFFLSEKNAKDAIGSIKPKLIKKLKESIKSKEEELKQSITCVDKGNALLKILNK